METDREAILGKIFLVRGRRVMLDTDLAEIYGVSTRRLNEQYRRNRTRFPDDFAFQLRAPEVAAIGRSFMQRRRDHLPIVFTEHGAIMLASVLNSPAAISASVEVVRAFVRLRGLAAEYSQLASRLADLEKRYDGRFKVVFEVIRRLTEPPYE